LFLIVGYDKLDFVIVTNQFKRVYMNNQQWYILQSILTNKVVIGLGESAFEVQKQTRLVDCNNLFSSISRKEAFKVFGQLTAPKV
jgi:hypothetical protein